MRFLKKYLQIGYYTAAWRYEFYFNIFTKEPSDRVKYIVFNTGK